jgi:succinate dehydrogenase / fumarate reductase flavoprotein subunit
VPQEAIDVSVARVDRLNNQTGGESAYQIGADLRKNMQAHCGVFRFPDMLVEGVVKMKEIAERAKKIEIKDKSKVFNTARVEALEMENLVEVALASMVSAEARKETRGAHDRADFHQRDDVNWLKHSLWYRDGNRMDYKPVHSKPLTVDTFVPKARTY